MEARDYRRGPRTTLRELKMEELYFAAFAVMAPFAIMLCGVRVTS